MFGFFDNISIEGIQAVVPSHIVNNIDFVNQIGEKRCKEQIHLTGVMERHICIPGQTSADLGYTACINLINNLGWAPETVDVLVFVTQTPLPMSPSTAFFLRERLGLTKECMAFDLNLGCLASTMGILTVASLLQVARPGARGILVIGDVIYPLEGADIDTLVEQMSFGAAGSAVALEKTDTPLSLMYFKNKFDDDIFHVPDETYIGDGENAFQFAINRIANDIVSFRQQIGITDTNIDFYSFSQAQALLLSTLVDACAMNPEKEIRSLAKFGNTDGSSPLVTLCAHAQKLKKSGINRVLLCGFDVGLSWCSIYTTIFGEKVYPILNSDNVCSWNHDF